MKTELLSYADVLRQTTGKSRHILLGNGFSIACRKCFDYRELYEAIADSISDETRQVFRQVDTHNVEHVLHHYEEVAHRRRPCEVLGKYDRNRIEIEARSLREMFLHVIAGLHPEQTLGVSPGELASCRSFLHAYSTIYSTNYDLLLHWVLQHARADADTNNSAIWSGLPEFERRQVYFLHGAMHLLASSTRMPRDLVAGHRQSLNRAWEARSARDYFSQLVAEGSGPTKRRQIQRDPYLTRCFREFGQLRGNLITFGFSYSENDRHLAEAIFANPNLENVWVGVFCGSRDEQGLIERVYQLQETYAGTGRQRKIAIHFYETSDVQVWAGESVETAYRHLL